MKFIFSCFPMVSSCLNLLYNGSEVLLIILVWFSMVENELNHVKIEINNFCIRMKCIWLVMHCLTVLVFVVITCYKVVSVITALLQNSYLWSLWISAKDVLNFNSKVCTIFLLESILYTSNFPLMEDSLLYVWFGLFVHSLSHICNIRHVNYRLQFTTHLVIYKHLRNTI